MLAPPKMSGCPFVRAWVFDKLFTSVLRLLKCPSMQSLGSSASGRKREEANRAECGITRPKALINCDRSWRSKSGGAGKDAAAD